MNRSEVRGRCVTGAADGVPAWAMERACHRSYPREKASATFGEHGHPLFHGRLRQFPLLCLLCKPLQIFGNQQHFSPWLAGRSYLGLSPASLSGGPASGEYLLRRIWMAADSTQPLLPVSPA
jgi:hypothetical protein